MTIRGAVFVSHTAAARNARVNRADLFITDAESIAKEIY